VFLPVEGYQVKKIILVLDYPVSANVYWRTRVVPAAPGRPAMAMTYVSPEAKAYQKKVLAAARTAGVMAPMDGRVQIDVRLYPNRPQDWQKRQRQLGANWDDGVRCIDLDNANKVLLDSLKGVVFIDDSWQVRRMVAERMEPDHLGARVVVRVVALEVEQPQLALIDGGTA
jgi:crossover junction endodeoxyribonuclease RusA